MKRYWRDVRLIPVVLLASISLFVLKVSGLVFDGGYTLGERLQARDPNGLKIVSADTIPARPRIIVADSSAPKSGGLSGPAKPWAQEMFNFNADSRDITGSVGETKDEKKDAASAGHKEEAPTRIEGMPVSQKPPEPTRVEVGGAVVQEAPGRLASPGERAVLERLQERRQALDGRSRELDMRESLLKAAEQRMDVKLGELRSMEKKVDSAETSKRQVETDRFKSIVAMYENMKSKDAARIFERLDMKVLVEVSTQMKPAKMAEILGQMSPDAAERLTVELANRANGVKPGPDQLPKIEGRPAQ
jgi:flagellar motility protein MotE (MotC chaperone)